MHLSQVCDFIARRFKSLIAVFPAQLIQFFYLHFILKPAKMLLKSPSEGFQLVIQCIIDIEYECFHHLYDPPLLCSSFILTIEQKGTKLHRVLSLSFFYNVLKTETTRSTVKPYSLMTVSPGALAPNVSIAIIAP